MLVLKQQKYTLVEIMLHQYSLIFWIVLGLSASTGVDASTQIPRQRLYCHEFLLDHSVMVTNNTCFSQMCCAKFPDVTAMEKECGLQRILSISWERAEVNTTISWCGSTSNEPTVSQLASDEDSYEVKYSDTDLMEITVNFCNQVRDCCKTTTFHYPVERVLTSVSLREETLVIDSRNCVANPDNYKIVVTSPDILPKELGNISFSQNTELDLGNVLKANTEYTIRVQLVENTSGTTIDERNTTLIYTAAHELCATEATSDVGSDQTISAVGLGIAGGVVVGLVVGAVVTVFVMLTLGRKKRTSEIAISGTSYSSARDPFPSAMNVVYKSKTHSVVYDTVGDVITNTDPSTSANAAYDVSKPVSTKPNPAYGELTLRK